MHTNRRLEKVCRKGYCSFVYYLCIRFTVLESQIEKFPTLYLEAVIKKKNRLVLTGKVSVLLSPDRQQGTYPSQNYTNQCLSISLRSHCLCSRQNYPHFCSLYTCRFFVWRCAGSNAGGTTVASPSHFHRSTDVKCHLYHIWTATDTE